MTTAGSIPHARWRGIILGLAIATLWASASRAQSEDQVKAGLADPQQRDKVTGERLWAVRVLDADPGSRKGQAEVAVKIAAPVQPLPPEAAAGTPFRPVEFDGLALMPYVDTSKTRPRLAFSIRATAMRAPGRPAKPVPSAA